MSTDRFSFGFGMVKQPQQNVKGNAPKQSPWDGIDGFYQGFYPLVNQHNYGKSPFFIGHFTISMVIFHSFL